MTREMTAEPRPRRRLLVGACLLAVVTAALLSRRFPLPGIFAEYTGDALYTVAAYTGLALLSPAARPALLAVFSWGFSALVETSQLLTWQWLVDLRANSWAALLLGQGWQWVDFVAYTIGALTALAIDHIGRRAHHLRT